MAHGFDTDADAIADLTRRVEHLEGQIKIHATNAERMHGSVNAEMQRTRTAAEEVRADVARMHKEVVSAHLSSGA